MADRTFALNDIFTPLAASCFQPGRTPTVDYEGSHAVAAAIGMLPGYWYANVWRACRERPLSFQNAELVEGWLLLETPTCVLLLEHAWIERVDRTIIDPSLVLLLSREHLSLTAYFPGMRYPCMQMQQVLQGELPLVYAQGGLTVPCYGHAYHSALAEASSRAHALTPPRQVWVVPAALSAIAGESLALLFSLLLPPEERRASA